MKTLAVVTPNDLGTTFVFNAATGKYDVIVPGVEESEGNALIKGPNGGPFLDKSKLKQVRLVQDTANKIIRLYEYPAGSVFDASTATVIGTASTETSEVAVDDVAIGDNGLLTFTDVQSGKTFELDTSSILRKILVANSKTIKAQGDGTATSELSLDLIISTDDDNILQITEKGAHVSKNDILSLINAAKPNVGITVTKHFDENRIEFKVGDNTANLNVVQLQNCSGEALGYLIDKE